MKNILIIGAGRSSTALIDYMLNLAGQAGYHVTVADSNVELAQERVGDHPQGRGVWLDVMKTNDRRELIERSDVVISLLPAHLHFEVAIDCIRLKKHLITASYVSKEIYELADEARNRDLLFMGEMGLDPGIDHMSAMQSIDEIKRMGGKLIAFRSYTGGLIAPESNDNPWDYKFTWNPRNVVRAGQGTAQYLEDGKYKFIPYHRLFTETEELDIDGLGKFEAYANRDSLLYREIYGLGGIPNILRGTIRYSGYCRAWNALIQLGLTDGSFPILESDKMTYNSFMDSFLPGDIPGSSVKDRTANFLGEDIDSEVMQKLEWLGLFSKKRVKLKNAPPAVILENILLDKWKLKSRDKDMIVMQHQFEYKLKGKLHHRTSTMILKGENANHTAMAKLVGIPLGIFVKLLLQNKITQTGVKIPVMEEVYRPVLKELEEYGVVFKEVDRVLENV